MTDRPGAALTLFHSPGACSRVPLIQLEETGARYELKRVAAQQGETRSAAFLRLNPKGKVPVLVDGAHTVTENVAIAFHLAQRFPAAGLLPSSAQPAALTEALSLMSWCASGLHPPITRLRLPQRFHDDPQQQGRVRELAAQELGSQFDVAEQRLANGPWLLGDAWCAADAYLFWACGRTQQSGVDFARWPLLAGHVKRMHERPAVMRALEREAADPA